MKYASLLDDATARALEFAWLRTAVAPASEYGERVFASLVPFRPGEETPARARAERVARIARRYEAQTLDTAREIFRNVPDAAGAIARASMGDVLSDANFLELQRFFDACVRLDALLHDDSDVPETAGEAVRACARALELGRAGKFGFYLNDSFDAALEKARGALAQAQAEYDAARGRSAASVAAALGRDIPGSEFIVMRADVQGPIPPGVRVVREAPTYLLCELDSDDATLAALERRDSVATAVAAAEEMVRSQLSDFVRARAASLDAAANAFGEADVLIAGARFSRAHDAEPATVRADPALSFERGRFVPLALELEREGRRFTPVSVALEGLAVLTGPNMGGKSVCLRTCGFIVLCAAFGLPVPASRAETALFDRIAWLGIGTDDEAGGLLSSFAREVVRLRDVLAHGMQRGFVLMDEFARTTTPAEGRALLVAVIRRFCERRAVGMVATHLAGIAEAAGVRHFAVRGLRGITKRPATESLHAALAALGESMDYTIAEVTDGEGHSSDAIALASLLGLDDALTSEAYAAMKS